MIVKFRSRLWIVGMALLAAGALAAGCGSNATSPGSRTTSGSVAVGMRAATSQESAALGSTTTLDGDGAMGGSARGVPLQSLALTIDRIRIYPAEHDSSGSDDRLGEDHGEGDADSASTPPLDFAIPSQRVEVSALGDSLTILLASLNVPDGKYTHLSIHVTAADGVLQDGQTIQVHLVRPDDLLMVQVPFTVTAGAVTPIVLVVDLTRSVHEVPPGSGNYVLRPVLWGEMGVGEDHWRRGGDHMGGDRGDGGMHP